MCIMNFLTLLQESVSNVDRNQMETNKHQQTTENCSGQIGHENMFLYPIQRISPNFLVAKIWI